MKAIRRFLAWAKEEGEMVNAQAKLPKLPERLVEILEPKEIDLLEDTAVTERDKVIVRVLAQTGMRRAELAALRVQDLQDQGGRHYLYVQGKGKKDRLAPIEPALFRRLRRFVAGRPADADSDRLFLGLARTSDGRWLPLSDNGVTQMVTALGERSGIPKKITPHIFRHTAATLMLRSGMNPLLVAQVLGHNSLQMITKVYSHLTPTDAHRELMRSLKARRGESMGRFEDVNAEGEAHLEARRPPPLTARLEEGRWLCGQLQLPRCTGARHADVDGPRWLAWIDLTYHRRGTGWRVATTTTTAQDVAGEVDAKDELDQPRWRWSPNHGPAHRSLSSCSRCGHICTIAGIVRSQLDT